MINQTNRTMLFDVVNPEVYSLFNLMAGVDETVKSLTDEQVKEINQQLLVSSFDEFLKKFKPTIYGYFDENNQPQHSMVKPVGIPDMFVKKIVLDRNNRILKMFTSMMDRKRSSNATNVSFDYEAVTKMLAPEKALKEMQKLKMDIKFLEEHNAVLESDSPAKADAVKKLLAKYEATKKYFNETGVQLTLMTGMFKENLLLMAKAKQRSKEYAPPALPVFENGELVSLKPSPEFLALSAKSGGAATALLEADTEAPAKIDYQQYTIDTMEKYYDTSMEQVYASVGKEYDPSTGAFQRELVLSAFTDKPNMALMEMGPEDKAKRYNYLSAVNVAWEKSFIREAKVLIEKLLNVKAYFDQYDAKLPKMKPKLFVINARLDEIVEEDNLRKLQQYLESVNNKMECIDTIWFGIVPDIKYAEGSNELVVDKQTLEDMGYTGDFDIGTAIEPNEMTCLQQLLEGIEKYRIQTFFSFETGEDTTFSRLATHGVDRYIEKTQDLDGPDYGRFAIPCLPNFTIIPRDRSKVVYGSKVRVTEDGVEFSEDVEEQFKFWIYGVYVSAAYVAAGLVAAYQCPNYLSGKFGRVLKDSPGVRFDIEAEDYASVVTTTFAKEISGITNDDKRNLNQSNFGFVFSSDQASNVTVYKSRCMHQKDGSYVSIFKETTKSYLTRMLNILSKEKTDGIKRQYAPGGQVKKWELTNGYVNSILWVCDEMKEPSIENGIGQIEVGFGGMSEYIELRIITD